MKLYAGLLMATVALGMAMPAGADGPWRASDDNTRGWNVMTPQERIEHQARVREFTDYDACETYRTAHDALMARREQQLGLAAHEDKHERAEKKDFCRRLERAKASQSDER